jgi:glycosyltransferase involved in cell wall biosynthesis
MKIIHIFNELKFSGAEIMYADASSFFIEKGCELTALSTSGNIGEYASILEKKGYKTLHKPYPKTLNCFSRISYYIKFIYFLKGENFDVVHIHRNSAMWGFSLCGWLARKKVIYTFHNVFKSKRLTYLYHYLLRRSAKNIFGCKFHTISDSVFYNELNYYKNKTTKIYNWYGNKRYYPAFSNEKKNFRNDLKILKESLVIISIGGCSHIKRHTDIIKALLIIVKKYPDCIYLHLGKGIDEEKEFKLVEDLGLEKNVRFCENQIDVRKYLISSDIYLMPSKYEGIPITTIEAMACKIPAILYDVPGLRDFNLLGQKNSLLIPEDFKTLAEKVLFLAKNKTESDRISESGKNFVDKYFNLQINANKIFELYNI